MENSKETVKKILANNIRNSAAGSNIPDSLMFSFLDMFTNYSINNNCLVTELLVQWLEHECGLPARQVDSLLILSREQIRVSTGIDVLMPGQKSSAGERKENKSAESDKWGKEWNEQPGWIDDPDEEEFIVMGGT